MGALSDIDYLPEHGPRLSAAPMSSDQDSTRAQLLRQATELMSLQGPNQTTIREIAEYTGQNVSAVNYHFGSKDRLVQHVLLEAVEKLNNRRLALLDEAQARSAPGPAPIAAVLDALLRPMVEAERAEDGGRIVIRLLTHIRASVRGPLNEWLSQHFEITGQRFISAMAHARPELTRTEIIWRYEFVRGAAMHALADLDPRSKRLEVLSNGACNIDDDSEVMTQLLAFAVRGFA